MAEENQSYVSAFLEDVFTPETEKDLFVLLTSPQDGGQGSPLSKLVKNVQDSGWLSTPEGRTVMQTMMRAGLAGMLGR